jgi:soluble lytic murein transglycosylase
MATDPIARRTLTWRLTATQSSDATFEEVDAALKELQNWPGRETMRRRGEQMIFDSSYGPADRVAWLKAEGGPLTGDGQTALAQAYARLGRTSEANALAGDTWRERALTPRAEGVLLAEFGGVLTREDHADRVDRLLWRDDRGGAQRLLARLGPGERAAANARIALQQRRSKGLQRVVDAVPSSHRDDAGFLYDRARYIRRSGRP